MLERFKRCIGVPGDFIVPDSSADVATRCCYEVSWVFTRILSESNLQGLMPLQLYAMSSPFSEL